MFVVSIECECVSKAVQGICSSWDFHTDDQCVCDCVCVKCGVTWEPLTLRLVRRDVDTEGEADNHGPQAGIPHGWTSTKIAHNIVYYRPWKGLQPHARANKIDPSHNLLFKKIPGFQLNHIHFWKLRKWENPAVTWSPHEGGGMLGNNQQNSTKLILSVYSQSNVCDNLI